MNSLHIISYNIYYKDVLEYIYHLEKDKINDFVYLEEQIYKKYTYNMTQKNTDGKVLIPGELDIIINYIDTEIKCEHTILKDHNNNIKTLSKGLCSGASTDILFNHLKLSHKDKDLLTEFIDEARKYVRERVTKTREKTNDTIRVFYYKDYWNLFSKIPKRPIDTLYLKENERGKLINSIKIFFSDEEKRDYLSFGIPYKQVVFLHGVPGSGKTTTINTISSYFNCDIHIIPLSTDMDDSSLVEAFGSINTECSRDNEEERRKIIVIEDIDCIFEDRKEGDHLKNKLTLHGLLNCMDGFTCIEGALIFITANKPETLDNAMIRSCRIDIKVSIGYADKYQTECMYKRFLPNQIDKFDKFYSKISHKKYTTAMLQELLFYNRKCDNILDYVNDFQKIIDGNNSNNFDKDTKVGDNYM